MIFKPETENTEISPEERLKKRKKRLVQGMFLGLGAPLGWAVIVFAGGFFNMADARYQVWIFIYMLVGSMIVFGAFGYITGRNEERFAALSLVDHLTGLYNPRYFHERVKQEFALAKRHGAPLTLILLDLDHFKKVNDTHGHQVGDLVLAEVARTVARTVRVGDTVARVGGEEFSVIMPKTDSLGGRDLAERIRLAVKENIVQLPSGGEISVKVSLGVSGMDRVRAETSSELFAAVDKALYEAKESGRDRVVEAEAKD